MDGESWYWGRHTCSSLGGDLVSFETQEEWSLINDEIQRRNTTNNENKWRIGLKKRARNWTWVSGRPLTISKWGQGEPSGEQDAAFMYKRFRNGERGVFGTYNNESWKKEHAYICEIPKGELICCCCCFYFYFFMLFWVNSKALEALKGNIKHYLLTFVVFSREIIKTLTQSKSSLHLPLRKLKYVWNNLSERFHDMHV